MGAAALPLIGVALGAATGAAGAAGRANAQIAASKFREQSARRTANNRANQRRAEGERFLGRQRSVIGRSGVGFQGSALQLLVDNATAIEEQAQNEIQRGLDVARLEDNRRTALRKNRDNEILGTVLEGLGDAVSIGAGAAGGGAGGGLASGAAGGGFASGSGSGRVGG